MVRTAFFLSLTLLAACDLSTPQANTDLRDTVQRPITATQQAVRQIDETNKRTKDAIEQVEKSENPSAPVSASPSVAPAQ